MLTNLKKSKGAIFMLSLAVVFVSAMLFYRWYLSEYGEFTIAHKIGVSKGGKNGSYSEYLYVLNDKKYEFSIGDRGTGSEYIFIKILLDYPKIMVVCSDKFVPNCLTKDSVLGYTWKEKPVCK